MARHTKIAPSFTIVLVELDDGSKEFKSLVECFSALEEHSDRVHCGCRVGIGLEGSFVGVHCLIRYSQQFREASCSAC